MSTFALPFESYGVTHKGCVRDGNEDNYLMAPLSGVWVVADGMGGHDAGEVASASIVAHLATIGVAESGPDLRARFEDRLVEAHDEIRTLALERDATIGSTFAALLAIDGQFACLWSGDSRVYLIRDGSISQLSRDHTEAQELVDAGVISESEARNWPRKNVITRAVGVTENIEIDARQGELLAGDTFVLGTDGLTAHVTSEEIEAAVNAGTPKEAGDKLLALVLDRGGTDNVTVIVVHVPQDGHPEAVDASGCDWGRWG